MAIHLENLRQGDDYKLLVEYANGFDITGYKFYLTLKNTFDDTDEMAVLSHSYIAGTNPTDDTLMGKCVFIVPASITANLPKGEYYYDFQAISPQSEIETLAPPIDDFEFKLKVIPQVTRAAT